MNRKERRAFDEKLKQAGFSESQRKNINVRLKVRDLNWTANPTTCWEGEKVQIDYDRITAYPDYNELRQEYKDFIESSKNKIFTVEFDAFKKTHDVQNKDSMVCLVEDETKPKWMFWAGDLIPVKGQIRPVNKSKEQIKLEEYMKEVDAIIEQVKGD